MPQLRLRKDEQYGLVRVRRSSTYTLTGLRDTDRHGGYQSGWKHFWHSEYWTEGKFWIASDVKLTSTSVKHIKELQVVLCVAINEVYFRCIALNSPSSLTNEWNGIKHSSEPRVGSCSAINLKLLAGPLRPISKMWPNKPAFTCSLSHPSSPRSPFIIFLSHTLRQHTAAAF